MFSKWFPSPSGTLDEKIEDLKFDKRSSDEESEDEEFSDESKDEEEKSKDEEYSEESEDEEFSQDSSHLSPEIDELDEDGRPSVGKLKGTYLDIIPFLSNNGKTTHLVRSNGQVIPIEDVRHKYLLICCVNLPVECPSSDYDTCRSLIDAYSELRGYLFEIVLVVNMKPRFHLRLDVFDAFFSAFHCLAVPFTEFETRNFISSFIGLKPGRSIETVLVDRTGLILQHRMASDYFQTFGSEWYPFTDDCVEHLCIQDDILRMRLDPFYRKRVKVSRESAVAVDSYQHPHPLSLYTDVFLCDPSLVLHRIDPAAGQSMTVSELSEKYVGLYLCDDGEFMDTLKKVHKKCVALKQELEIVIIGRPFSDDPKSYHQNLLEALKLSSITSWFVFPFEDNRMVCRRLWRVFAREGDYDKLIILPPYNSGDAGEIEARALIAQFGMNTYPFTATKIVEQRYNALKSLNALSWFKDSKKNKRTCLIRNDSEVHVRKSALLGKRLLLYLDSLRLPDNGELCYLLLEHYDEIKAKGCEVVFVPLDVEDVYLHDQHAVVDEMPWPIMPVQAAVDSSMIMQLLSRGHDDGLTRFLIAFGEDGKILSKCADRKLKKKGVRESLFADTLYKELVRDLTYHQTDEYDLFD